MERRRGTGTLDRCCDLINYKLVGKDMAKTKTDEVHDAIRNAFRTKADVQPTNGIG